MGLVDVKSDFVSQTPSRWCGEEVWGQLRCRPSHLTAVQNYEGTAEPLCSTPSLTFGEIYSIRKSKDLTTWRVPPSRDWYKRSSPGGSIGLACDRADQTALSRFVSGHLRSCSFSHGNKVFPVCAKCGVASASSEHILSCLRLSRETFETDPLLALDFLRQVSVIVAMVSGPEDRVFDVRYHVRSVVYTALKHKSAEGPLVWCGRLERGAASGVVLTI
ncbi:hypothetical protein AVEN_151322-1 [Araneus ventricosus]|uniref:Uncharacterized protein n=1 Tax=Araneus ventricosus TaxID=182803 RepID=A0A4Y2EAQ8_ARAVE|nr:hypothetical protein AVEN_151322-1 [Araneus ventricosus]